MPLDQSVPWKVEGPDDQALLIALQHLAERGFTRAVAAIEQQTGKTYLASKLPRGSMLLEVSNPDIWGVCHRTSCLVSDVMLMTQASSAHPG